MVVIMARKMKDVLQCAEKQNNYDETDINSIYQYALGIEGKTLLEILQEANLTEEDIEWVRTKETDKGLPGKIIEASYFGYELNSRQEADFGKVGAELKSTPADIDKSTQRYKSGETISVTQIDFSHPVEDDFFKSHLYDKLRMLLVIFYHRNKELPSKLFYNVFYATLFKPSLEDIAIIESDFHEINRKIRSGNAHLLSRSDGTYLSTAPKSTKTVFIEPYYGGEKIVKRSFTLRKEYVNVILASYYTRIKATKEEKFLSEAELLDLKRITFAEKIQERFKPYLYNSITQIAETLNLFYKQTNADFTKLDVSMISKATIPVLTARMLGLKKLKCEEFTKAGIVVKTIFFNVHGINKEEFRLDDVDFLEIYNSPDPYVEIEVDEETGEEYEVFRTGWTDSELYAQLDGLKYLFVVFQEDPDGEIIFKGSKLWAMSNKDIDLAFEDWMDIRKVLKDGVQLTRVKWGDGERTENNFPGVADARRIHLRPHGKKAFYVEANGETWGNGQLSDTEELPGGRRMTRQSYWLNNTFVREIVKDLLDKD